MTKQLKSVFLSAALAAMILPAGAQSTDKAATPSPAVPAPADGSAQQPVAPRLRQEKQQDRIANGINSGQLNASEAKALEKREASLSREAQRMKDANGGRLTAADKKKLENQENKISQQIYQQKHDDQGLTQNPKTALGKHEEQQQDRIAEGVKSGQLTAAEASHLENREAKINQEVSAERAANGGKLTQAEKNKLRNQEKRTSQAIYHQKHDAQNRK